MTLLNKHACLGCKCMIQQVQHPLSSEAAGHETSQLTLQHRHKAQQYRQTQHMRMLTTTALCNQTDRHMPEGPCSMGTGLMFCKLGAGC
jgi:hypothetical protein